MTPFLLITTGGTIDKTYDPVSGQLGFSGTAIPDRLKGLGVETSWEHRALMTVDSLEMTEDQRWEIARTCWASEKMRILVIHGTDTMVETAKVIESNLPVGVQVVMTGAMVPLVVKGSDGDFNLGCALANLQREEEGVFISMHGEIFPALACRKDRNLGRFVASV